MKKTAELQRQINKFRARSEHPRMAKAAARSPLTEVSGFRRLQITPMSEFNRHDADYILPANKYDENEKDKFELMNVKLVIYGLTGLICEQEPTKKQKFGKKETSSPAIRGFVRKEIKSLVSSVDTDVQSLAEQSNKEVLGSTTAVVSCQKNGTSNQISLETFLPSLPLGHPIATNFNKVRYAASWPSEQSVLYQDDGAKERSAFEVTRCMKQAAFIPGVGAGSNYCHETLGVGINISRGTELIRLGTALIVINGEEEGEVYMNIPTTPFVLNRKKLKKKKNKYGYFSNDSSRRYFLDDNSVLKVGVQVIPEEAMRFAREKEEKRTKKENELNELLEQDNLKDLLQQMGDDNLDREGIQIKSLPINPGTTANGIISEHKAQSNSFFPDIFCGSIPTSWIPNFLKRPETEPDIPMEIITDNNLDQLAIHSLISSVSESTDGSDIIEGEQNMIRDLYITRYIYAGTVTDPLTRTFLLITDYAGEL